MTGRSRIIFYGPAGLLIVAGAVGGALVGGEAGGLIALVLVGLGFVAIAGLVFFEVGLSEDQERERERRAAQARSEPAKRAATGDRRRRLQRLRGECRRLG